MGRPLFIMFLVLAGFLSVAAATAVGPGGLALGDVLGALWGGPPRGGGARDVAAVIVWELRLPRACLAYVVGAALGLSGAIFQGLFRNPLADPFVIGISGGASVGAVAALALGASTEAFGLGPVPLFAFGGGLAAAAVVYALGRSDGRAPVETLLLAGVAVGAFCAALTALLLWLNTAGQPEMILWLMGQWESAGWARVAAAFPYVAVAAAGGIAFARDLNALALGEEQARQLGVETERAKRVLLAAGTLAAAAAVAVAGLIGFVGLIVPHAVRRLAGADHRIVVPASALAGGVFLVAADAAGRSVGPSGLPLGVVTGLCGGPFFLYVLRRARRNEA